MLKTQLDYRITPPLLGQHTDEVLEELLDMGSDDRQALRDNGVI